VHSGQNGRDERRNRGFTASRPDKEDVDRELTGTEPNHASSDDPSDLSELIHLIGMVNRTDELPLLPVLSNKKTLHPHGFGVFAIWLRPLPTNVQ
jgi:hypothetical protein